MRERIEDITVIAWLKNYFDKKELKDKNLEPILHFSLLWNLFEHTFPPEQKEPYNERLRYLAAEYHKYISEETLNVIYSYFKKRYIIGNEINVLFDKLLFKKKEYEECQKILLSDNPHKEDRLKCVLLIIYRFRNNLFHGNKNPKTLNLYSAQFKVINKFLMSYIEATAEKYGINRNN